MSGPVVERGGNGGIGGLEDRGLNLAKFNDVERSLGLLVGNGHLACHRQEAVGAARGREAQHLAVAHVLHQHHLRVLHLELADGTAHCHVIDGIVDVLVVGVPFLCLSPTLASLCTRRKGIAEVDDGTGER